MAFTSIIFKNTHTGAIKSAPVGFSWTVFLFGFFPPLFRSDWKWFFIILLASFFTVGLSNIVFAFIYNKLHIVDLIGKGYKGQSIPGGDMSFASTKLGIEIPTIDTANVQ